MRRSASSIFVIAALLAGCSGGNGSPAAGIVGGTPTLAPTTAPSSGATTPAASATPTAKATATAVPTTTPAPTSTPAPVGSPTPKPASAACANAPSTAIFDAGGGSVSTAAQSGTLTETLAANKTTNNLNVSLCYVPQSNLPAPLLALPHVDRSGRRLPSFTAGAGNTYIAALYTSLTGGPASTSLALSAANVVASTIGNGTQLNIAILQGGTWVDIGTALVSSTGAFGSTPPTSSLPGIVQTGTYLVYLPAGGTNTAQINLGFALLADDGTVSVDGLQFVQLEDGSGNAIPTPTTTYFPVTGSDLDGQSLTPDASQGATIDGGATVNFFSGIPQHAFTLSTKTVSVGAYGSDGDAIASLPNGDEVVVTADNDNPLAVISGILSGNPVIADTVNPSSTGGSLNQRDGLVLSADGKTMLSRGSTGIDAYQITPTAAHAGSTNTGTTSFTFKLVLTSVSGTAGAISRSYFEDGRDGMAISPTDSSRAVVVGVDSTSKPTVQLLTGLTGSSPTINSVRAMFQAVPRRIGQVVRRPEPSAHRLPFAVSPSVGATLYAVTISPDGTTAYVSSDAGILTFGGVATGALTQLGSAYAPTISIPGGGTCPATSAASIGVLPDGKYLIEILSCGESAGSTNATQGSGVVLTVPIGSGGALGAPVGQLNNVVTPSNDQIIIH